MSRIEVCKEDSTDEAYGLRVVGWVPVRTAYVGRHQVWTANGWQWMELWQWQWYPVWG